jgi:hypothetical protein
VQMLVLCIGYHNAKINTKQIIVKEVGLLWGFNNDLFLCYHP